MLGCAPAAGGVQSIKLGGPVIVISRSRASAAAGEARSLSAGGGRPFTDAATSRADVAAAVPTGRASCRGDISGFALSSAGLPLPGDFGNKGNAIAALALMPLAHYVPFARMEQEWRPAGSNGYARASVRLEGISGQGPPPA